MDNYSINVFLDSANIITLLVINVQCREYIPLN